MIPLIAHTPRLILLAASRALLTAELHKPQYFPVLLGAALPRNWPPSLPDRATLEHSLAQLTAGGRVAAGWYSWYAVRRATPATPATLVGTGGFSGPPDAHGTVEISCSVAADWRGQGIATEIVAGLVDHAARTGLVRRLRALGPPGHAAWQQVLLRNGFGATATAANGHVVFELSVEG